MRSSTSPENSSIGDFRLHQLAVLATFLLKFGSTETIASSFGVASFDKVLEMFYRSDFMPTPPLGPEHEFSLEDRIGSRWGFLKLLQEAKIGDTLSLLGVGFFGKTVRHPVGQLSGAGCTILAGNMPLKEWVMSSHAFGPRAAGVLGNRVLQAYYLNDRPFRDGCGPTGYCTDLPDFAAAQIDFDVYAPPGWGGLGVGNSMAYIVDRYGRAYVSLLNPSLGLGLGPASFGYVEGWINYVPGDHLSSPEELERDIMDPSAFVGVNLLQ